MENTVSVLYIGVSPAVIEKLTSHDEIEMINHRNLQSAENHLKTGQKPDAILCDRYLSSGGDGIEYYDVLRKNPEFKSISFILLSDEFREKEYQVAIKKGVDDYYVFPDPTGEALLNRVRFLREYHLKYPVEPPVFAPDVDYKMPWSKRLFDIVVASTALVLLSPLLLLVIIAIRLESKGKVYYSSRRFGRKEWFDFYKLRSMRIGAEDDLHKLAIEKNQYSSAQKQSGVQTSIDYSIPCPECSKLPEGEYCSPPKDGDVHKICDYWFNEQTRAINKAIFIKIQDDPRVTRVGKFIRKTSIDELPQLINVIKGDMSIVGNRPLPNHEVEFLLTDKNPDKDNKTPMMRVLAPAGITGLWQVELRGKGGDMSKEERLQYDLVYYTEHMIDGKYSFWYDFTLILKTFRALFQKSSV